MGKKNHVSEDDSAYHLPSHYVAIGASAGGLEAIETFFSNMQPAGMIINELISNAFKYAFPQESSGTVKVFFKRPDKNLVSLIVYDDGIGISDDIDLENSTGFGLTLVNMLVSQLKGSVDIIRSKGTTFRITFPIGDE
jgi:two-component sensor histidine kinase